MLSLIALDLCDRCTVQPWTWQLRTIRCLRRDPKQQITSRKHAQACSATEGDPEDNLHYQPEACKGMLPLAPAPSATRGNPNENLDRSLKHARALSATRGNPEDNLDYQPEACQSMPGDQR